MVELVLCLWFHDLGLGLWCLTPLSTIFQLYHGSQFYWWRKPVYLKKTHQTAAGHWQTLSHNVVSSTPCLNGIWTHNISGDRHWFHTYKKVNVVINPTSFSTIRIRPWRPLMVPCIHVLFQSTFTAIFLIWLPWYQRTHINDYVNNN